jgi:hypothetical protein
MRTSSLGSLRASQRGERENTLVLSFFLFFMHPFHDKRGARDAPPPRPGARQALVEIQLRSGRHQLYSAWPGETQYAWTVLKYRTHDQACCNHQTLRQTWPCQINDRAAICVRHVSVSGALQFAVFHAVSSVLHRNASQVIHCSELYVNVLLIFARNARVVQRVFESKQIPIMANEAPLLSYA